MMGQRVMMQPRPQWPAKRRGKGADSAGFGLTTLDSDWRGLGRGASGVWGWASLGSGRQPSFGGPPDRLLTGG